MGVTRIAALPLLGLLAGAQAAPDAGSRAAPELRADNTSPQRLASIRAAFRAVQPVIASCGAWVDDRGSVHPSVIRCSCRALCRTTFPPTTDGSSSKISFPVSVSEEGLSFELDPLGHVVRCEWRSAAASVACDQPEPSAASWRAGSELDRAPSTLMLPGLRVDGVQRVLSHTHGGDPAHLLSVDLRMAAAAPASLALERAWLMRSHCYAPAWQEVIALQDLALNGSRRSALLVPRGESTVHLSFRSTDVYEACDVFGVRVQLRFREKSWEVEVPLKVYRFEPDAPL